MASVGDGRQTPRVTRLVVYPVKGCAGQVCDQVVVGARGLAWDRRWMFVGEDGAFLSQRQFPALATIRAWVAGGELRLSHPRADSEVVIPVTPPAAATRRRVRIWRDEVDAVCLPRAGALATELLGHPCELVFMPGEVQRRVNPAFAGPDDLVGFADAYPVLLVGEASLADLNARLAVPAPVDRFRPNVVVSTVAPFVEDGWGELEIGGARLCGVKACERCAVPTVDQDTGERRGPEPIRTLSTYRRLGGKGGGSGGVFFGQNLVVRHGGKIALGDPVTVLGRTPAVY